MREYETLVKKLCKSYKHDLSAFRKIEELKKYLSSVLNMDSKGMNRNSNRNSDFDMKATASLLETSPSD